jgi:hypothetical protein
MKSLNVRGSLIKTVNSAVKILMMHLNVISCSRNLRNSNFRDSSHLKKIT